MTDDEYKTSITITVVKCIVILAFIVGVIGVLVSLWNQPDGEIMAPASPGSSQVTPTAVAQSAPTNNDES